MKLYRILLVGLLFLVFSVVGTAQDTGMSDSNQPGCVEEYDPDLDYFPEKVELTDAENFVVNYFNNYKVVTVIDAFDGADQFSYVLVQCGTPAPPAEVFSAGTQFIEVPAGRIITLSTTQLPHLTELGLLDRLVGVDSFDYINTPEVRELISDGAITAVGFGSAINLELVLSLEPDLVMTSGYDPSTDAHPVLMEADIFTAINAEWREATPLGRAEWIKFTALFYNVEAEAEAAFAEISGEYNVTRDLAANVPVEEQPVVLWNRFSPYTESWTIPGAETYVGRLIHDAGGIISLGDLAPEDSITTGFEVIYDGALDADLWVLNAFAVDTMGDLMAEDSRYVDFAAVSSGQVWNDNNDVNENGGNNYYELGVTNPHLILRDLVAMFHPELMPDHQFMFYRPLE